MFSQAKPDGFNQCLHQKPVFSILLQIPVVFLRENGFLETFLASGYGIIQSKEFAFHLEPWIWFADWKGAGENAAINDVNYTCDGGLDNADVVIVDWGSAKWKLGDGESTNAQRINEFVCKAIQVSVQNSVNVT